MTAPPAWPRSRIPSRPLARWAARRHAPNGCGDRRAPCRRSTASTGRLPRRSSPERSKRGADDVWLSAGETRQLLLHYGVPLVPERVVESAADAVAAARELGFPCVVKTAVAGAHKTEIGGLALDLPDEAAVAGCGRPDRPARARPADAARRSRAAGRRRPGSRLRAARRVRSRRRLRGADRRCRLPDRAAHGHGRQGARRRRERRASSWQASVARRRRTAPRSKTSCTGSRDSAEDLPSVAELDLNPVLARPDGCVALDARVRVRRSQADAATQDLVAASQ